MILQVTTRDRQEMVRITRMLAQVVEQEGWKDGMCTVFVPHTTAGVTINENADPDVVKDLLYALDRMVPAEDPAYRHVEGNSAAHMKSSLVGFSQTVIVKDGQLALGTWQDVIFCEFDGPRQRQVMVEFVRSR